jgi:hypothetical protein
MSALRIWERISHEQLHKPRITTSAMIFFLADDGERAGATAATVD